MQQRCNSTASQLHSVISRNGTIRHHFLNRSRAIPWLRRFLLSPIMFTRSPTSRSGARTVAGPSSSMPTTPATATTATAHPLHEVFENQRWLGTWSAPVAVLDRAPWSDIAGTEVALTEPPTLNDDTRQWEVVVNESTDHEGWQYATVFNHLNYKRPGGRASHRFGDTVRRRAWRRRDHAVVGAIAQLQVPTAATVAAIAQREAEAKNKAIRGFMSMVLDLLSRRRVWTLVPWDPAALFVLYRRHREIYQQLQTQAYQRQIFSGENEPPVALLHPDGSGTLLQDLLCAAVHSRAAYGFAMAAGHINSISSYIKLQTLQPLTFNVIAGASIESNNEAVAALAGVPTKEILLSHWRNSPFRPCHYVAIDRVNRCVVVSIRGTLEMGDLLSDLAAEPMEVSINGVDGWVHQGILAAASYIHCTTEAALREAAWQCPGWPVLLTGHSLGGGVAALLCMLLRERGGVPGLGGVFSITVGSAAVMSESLAAACEEYCISVILGSDVIPHLSYASVEALLVEASEASPVRRAAEGLKKKLDQVLGGGVSSSTAAAAFTSTSTSTSASGGVGTPDGRLNNNNNNGGGGWRSVEKAAERVEHQNGVAGQGLALVLSPSPFKKKVGNGDDVEANKEIPVINLQQQQCDDDDGGGGGGAATTDKMDVDSDREEKHREEEEEEINDDNFVIPVVDEERIFIQQQQQQQFMNDDDDADVLEYSSLGADGNLATAAMAQHTADKSGTGSSTFRSSSSSTISSCGRGDKIAGDPEHLFPPGRLLWVFPGDEDVNDLTAAAATATATTAPPVAVQDDDLSATEAEEKLGEAWETTWEGSHAIINSHPTTTAQQEVEMEEEDAGDAKAREESSSSLELNAATPKMHSTGEGKVNMDEAEEDVKEAATGQQHESSSSAEKVKRAGAVPPVVVEAERPAFERMLLLPDMMNDHLPHRYLEALQQL